MDIMEVSEIDVLVENIHIVRYKTNSFVESRRIECRGMLQAEVLMLNSHRRTHVYSYTKLLKLKTETKSSEVQLKNEKIRMRKEQLIDIKYHI